MEKVEHSKAPSRENLKIKKTSKEFQANRETQIRNSETLKEIRLKKENPFWMPTLNEDIFEIRDILRQEKELKKALDRSKNKKRREINDIHGESLRVGVLEKKANLYLTETNHKNVNHFLRKYSNLVNTIKSDNSVSNLPPTQTGTKILQVIEEDKQIELEKNKDEDRSSLLQRKIETLGAKKRENVRDYINKTRELILMKYIINVKNESLQRLEETDKNEIESIKDSLFSMEEAENLFKQHFYTKYEEYMKNLLKQKEKEKLDLNLVLEEKMKLDAEKSKYASRISKLEKEKKNYEECQEFMIRVKEKRLEIPARLREEANMNSNQEVLTTISDIFKETQTKINHKSYNKRGSNLAIAYANIYKEQDERIKGYLRGNTIFNEPNDLIEEIKKMEIDNINRLEEFNKLNYEYNESTRELEKIREENKKIYLNNSKDIENKEKKLKELLLRNKKLTEERKNLLLENKDYSFTNNTERQTKFSTKNKVAEPQLFAKIVEVYNSVETDFDKFTENLDPNKKNIKDLEYEMLAKLKTIEKSLDFLIDKYRKYSNDSSKLDELRVKEVELENDRKAEKSRDLKKKQELDEIRKRIENEERNNRILIIPKRKTMEHCPPRKKENKINKIDKIDQNELGFDDYI